MKIFFRLILIGLVFCTTGNSQSPQSQAEPMWTSLQPEGEIFSVELPSTVSSDRSHDKSQNKFWTSIDGNYFMIFSEKSDKLHNIRIALEYIRSYEKQGEKQRIGLVETERFDFKDQDGFYHSVVSFDSGQRAYLFHGISRAKDEPLVSHFFRSLLLNGLQVIQTEEPEKSMDLPAGATAPRVEPSGVTGYGGIGSGQGNGSGNSSNADNSQKVLPITTRLKVLSAPRATYTDLARIYEIQGISRLKVTLLSTGEVGSISPITYLPFGLTTNAIQAARRIRFQPRAVNGVPLNSIITMEYSFRIY